MKKQKVTLSENTISPRIKLFLSSSSVDGLFGNGKWRLLQAVKNDGSIQKAAQRLGRSYRKAWGDIRQAEKGLGKPLVVRSRGGAHGGGTTVLTLFGEQLLNAWERYRLEIDDTINDLYQKHLKELIEGNNQHKE